MRKVDQNYQYYLSECKKVIEALKEVNRIELSEVFKERLGEVFNPNAINSDKGKDLEKVLSSCWQAINCLKANLELMNAKFTCLNKARKRVNVLTEG